MKILFSWVGHADLLDFAGEYPEVKEQIKLLVKKQDFIASGPIKVTISQKKFDKIVLLWTYDAPKIMELYRQYCGEQTVIRHIPLVNPTDYRAVYCAARDVVAANCSADDELYYLLSPGTPAMANDGRFRSTIF